MPRLAFGALLVVVSLASSVARADVVGAPPADCPPGTLGDACHGGPFCSALRCDDGACPSDQRCERRSFCVRQVACGGWGSTREVTDARGTCSPSASCPPDRTCEEIAVCVPIAAPEEDAGGTEVDASAGTEVDASAGTDGGDGREQTSYGCGCRAGGRTSSRLAALALALSLTAAASRRTRRRR